MDDDRGAVAARLFKGGLSFNNYATTAVCVHLADRVNALQLSGERVLDVVITVEDAASWEVGRKDEGAQLLSGEVWVLYKCNRRVGNLAKVVRRNVGGHTNGNSG